MVEPMVSRSFTATHQRHDGRQVFAELRADNGETCLYDIVIDSRPVQYNQHCSSVGFRERFKPLNA